MAKGKTTAFFCKECGYETSKWLGQCPGCKEWNTFVEELVTKKTKGLTGKNILESKPVAIMKYNKIFLMAAKLARSSYGLSIADCFFSKYNYLINFEYDYLRKIIFKTLKIPLYNHL